MTVYLRPGMAFAPEKKRIIEKQTGQKNRIYLPSKKLSRRKALRQIISTFFTSTLIILNIGLIAIAGLWFQLVFSVVTPYELTEMVLSSLGQTSVNQTVNYDHAEAIVNIPPPPILSVDSYGGLGIDALQKSTQ